MGSVGGGVVGVAVEHIIGKRPLCEHPAKSEQSLPSSWTSNGVAEMREGAYGVVRLHEYDITVLQGYGVVEVQDTR
jgi:hypothetical protein